MALRPSRILFLVLGLCSWVRGDFVTYYMEKKTGETVSADSVRLETSLTRAYRSNVNAWVVVTSSAGFATLTAYMMRFDLEKRKDDGTCYDYLNIYDGSGLSAPRLNAKPLCGTTLTVTRYNSSGRSLTFQFVTDGSAEMTGMEIIINSVVKGTCTDSNAQFQCTDKVFCIAKSLRCDSFYHCADGSDEDTAMCEALAAATNSVLYGIVIGSIFGGIAFIIILAFLIYYCMREHKYRRLLAQLRQERFRKNQVCPVVENEYPVTNTYRKREFQPMFRNEDIENKDWGLYHGPLYDPAYLNKLKKAADSHHDETEIVDEKGGEENEKGKAQENDEEKEDEKKEDEKKEGENDMKEEEKGKEKDMKEEEKGKEKEEGKDEERNEQEEKEKEKEEKDGIPEVNEAVVAEEALTPKEEKERKKKEKKEEKERREKEKREEKERKAKEKQEEKERKAKEKQEEKERKAKEKEEEKERKAKEKEEKEKEEKEKEEKEKEEKEGEEEKEKEKVEEGKAEEGKEEDGNATKDPEKMETSAEEKKAENVSEV